MNIDVVTNALGELNRILGRATSALEQIEEEVFQFRRTHDGGIYEDARLALGAILQELHDVLGVVLEAAEMPDTRASLASVWREFKADNDGLRHTVNHGQFEQCESPALTFIEHVIRGLELSVHQGLSSEAAWTLNRLEAILRDTAALVRQRGVVPKKEHDVQHVMHDYLSACFPSLVLDPKISGAIKNFKPDCGIASVNAAIEFKIVKNEKDVTIAFSGVTEDTAGYRGSKDWTRFYAVFYQSEPFMFHTKLEYDMKRIGATTWTPIIVNGPTTKSKRKAKSRTALTKRTRR